jgi:hypothetical protein
VVGNRFDWDLGLYPQLVHILGKLGSVQQYVRLQVTTAIAREVFMQKSPTMSTMSTMSTISNLPIIAIVRMFQEHSWVDRTLLDFSGNR